MKQSLSKNNLILIGIVCGLLLATAFLAGCTSTAPQSQTTVATPAPTPQQVVTTAAPASTPAATTTSTPKPTFTPSQGNVVAYTAASLTGVSPKLASDFEKMYPGHQVVFNLDGTQALKTQVRTARMPMYSSRRATPIPQHSPKGATLLTGTVKPLTSNYVIVILPAANPGNIKSLADLAKPGVKIAMEDKSVPAGLPPLRSLPTSRNPPITRTGTTPCSRTWSPTRPLNRLLQPRSLSVKWMQGSCTNPPTRPRQRTPTLPSPSRRKTIISRPTPSVS